MDILEKELESVSLTPTSAASADFAAVLDILDIIFSIKEGDASQIDIDTCKALRLTCKAIKDVVDTYVLSFDNFDKHYEVLGAFSRALA